MNVGELGAITAVVFVDGMAPYRDRPTVDDPLPGTPWKDIPKARSLDDWTIGAGGGIAIRVLRSAQLTITAARGAGVTRWYVSSGWSW